MSGLPGLKELKKISARLRRLDRDELRYKARRAPWMLFNGANELLRQGREELDVQKDASLREFGSLTRLIKIWLDQDMSLDERAKDTPELAERIGATLSEQLQRVIARSSDLTRATLAYTRAQSFGGDIRQYQANAPFLLTYHEAKAGVVLNNMPAHKRAALRPFAERIRDAQLQMGEKTSCYNDCAVCERPLGGEEKGGGCCSTGIAQMFRPIDGIYRQLLGERAPVWPELNQDRTRCGFMGPQGCILPAGTRPLTCVGFYCNDFRDKLDHDGVWRNMSPAFAELRAGIRELEFRFNLNRRFLLKNQPKTIQDSSIGLLYDKLMNLYASYDEITNMAVDGVDAVSDAAASSPEKNTDELATDEAVSSAETTEAGAMSYDEASAQVAEMLKKLNSEDQEQQGPTQQEAEGEP